MSTPQAFEKLPDEINQVLFVDPSVNDLGYTVYERTDRDWRPSKFGTYHTKTAGIQRVDEAAWFLAGIVLQNEVDFTVIEDPFDFLRKTRSGKPANFKSMKLLLLTIGGILATCQPARLYRWKEKETKRQTSANILAIYKNEIGERVTSEHCRDAMALGHKWISEARVRGVLK